mgnify:CR=1 FL=1
MKVSRVGPTKEAGGAKKKPKASGAGGAFADSLKGVQGPSPTSGALEASSVRGVDAMLAAQEVPVSQSDDRTRKKLQDYGDDLLDRLDDLRLGILLGAYSKDKLAELAQRLRQKRDNSEDRKLNEIIAEIELRVEVEIAKLTRRT